MGVRKDVFCTKRLCNARNVHTRRKIYFETNENLDNIFKNIDFAGKDVLSVLASSDQLFKLSSYDVKSIDTFDKNKLTYYYYYFRIWTIKYMKELYPTGLVLNDYDWIENLLLFVNPKTAGERDALFFWKKLLDKRVDFSKLFIIDKDKLLNYSKSDDSSKLPLKIGFSNVDLFKKCEFDKKYDIAVISNILEWTSGDARFIDRLASNLSKLLKDNGLVLCSRMIYDDKIYEVGLEWAMKDFFEFHDIDNSRYVYVKK